MSGPSSPPATRSSPLPPLPSPLSSPSLPPCRPADLAPSPLCGHDRALFNAFLRFNGDLEAIAQSLNIDECAIAEWAMQPAVDQRLNALRKLHRFTVHRCTTNALPDAVAKLRELVRSSTNEAIVCKASCALTRLSASQAPGDRASTRQSSHNGERPLTRAERDRLISYPNPDGTVFTFDPKKPFANFQGDPLAFLRDSRPVRSEHSPQGGVGEALRAGGGSISTDPSSPVPSIPAPADDHASSPSHSDLAPSSAGPSVQTVAASSPNTPSDPPLCPSVCSVVNSDSSSDSDPLSSAPSAANSSSSPNTSPDSALCPSVCSVVKSVPDPEGEIYRLMRPAPDFFPDPYEFPAPDPDDGTPFPRHDTDLYPHPAPGTTLPETLLDLVNTRELTPDQCLAIAKRKDPWIFLPKNGHGKPNRKKINKSGDLRRAYDKICYALIRARSLAGLALVQKWEADEFARVAAELAAANAANSPQPSPPPESPNSS